MHKRYPLRALSTLLMLIAATVIVVHEQDLDTAVQASGTARSPTAVDGTADQAVTEISRVVPTVEAIVVPTLAPGEPTPDFSLPPDASLDIPGVPALAPRTGDGSPTFTVAEIETYLAQEPHLYANPDYPPPEIASLRVMTAEEAAYVILGPIHRPEDALVLVVELRGHFYVAGPVGYALTGQSSYMIFDARTGNLLTIAVGP